MPSALDEEFIDACLDIRSDFPGTYFPLSSAETLICPPTGSGRSKLRDVDLMIRLTRNYPNAYYDFYGSDTPCIYKTGPMWPTPKGPDAQGIVHEARPIYRHPIAPQWLSIGKSIMGSLDSANVQWTSINPLAYAIASEAEPFCPFVVSIGVKPHTLPYEAAVAAATSVQGILAAAGFSDIEVAVVESVATRSGFAGPRLLTLDPLLDPVAELQKPFTSALGLPIAALKHPNYEGTGALYYRLGRDDPRVAVLTCAHVARPPPAHPTESMSPVNGNLRQARQEIITLGARGYEMAVRGIMYEIGSCFRSMDARNNMLGKLGDPVEGEDPNVTRKRTEAQASVARATRRIELANELHDQVTKRYSIPSQRVIGFVLHSEEAKLLAEPCAYTEDWALIELYDEKIDWSTFKGNQIFLGGNISIPDYAEAMFPRRYDLTNYVYPPDSALRANGIVQDADFRDPEQLDVYGAKCLLAVKNGLATGTTVGRVNGLESFTRVYDDRNGHRTSMDIAVTSYGRNYGDFSAAGDSGSIVLDRDGRIVGLLTGGAGSADGSRTVISYITPYWWLEEKIRARFPDCFLYDDAL